MEKKSKRKKIVAGVFIAEGIIIFLIVIILLCFLRPLLYYNSGASAMDDGKYSEAKEKFEKAGGFQDAKDRVKEAENGLHYDDGKLYYDKGYLKEAAEELLLADGFDDAGKMLGEIGIKLISEKEYDLAMDCLRESNTPDRNKYCDYITAMQKMNDGSYEEASELFESVGNLLEAGDMRVACDFEIAEISFKSGDYAKARELYVKLPLDTVHNGISSKSRIEAIDTMSSIAEKCGTFKATAQNITAKKFDNYNSQKYGYAWDSAVIYEEQKLTMECTINEDGKVTLKGTAKYYRCNELYDVVEEATAELTTLSFEETGVNDIPGRIVLDEYTVLTHSGNGVFNLEYSKRENLTTGYYVLYASSIVYSK